VKDEHALRRLGVRRGLHELRSYWVGCWSRLDSRLCIAEKRRLAWSGAPFAPTKSKTQDVQAMSWDVAERRRTSSSSREDEVV